MNSVVLFCAAVVGGGFFAPDFWGVSSEKAPTYQMEMVLVEVGANGQQQITTIPNIVVGDGQSVRVKCEDGSGLFGQGCQWRLIRCDEENCAFERHFTPVRPKGGSPWRVSLESFSPDQVAMVLAFRTYLMERAYRDRTVCREADRVVHVSMMNNRTHRLVLDQDEQGQPTAWIDLRIRETTSTQAASDQEEASENPEPSVRPFYYEPF